ncbi:peptidase domain-containing ABC transporter [Formosa algae]|uniref:ABC-type bacteriocin/lantibiotic exporter with double-glycine peptidase domain n=1 Tax=Formosa algae TaxID=225843 RepID=A0A9X0YKY3_9FLAO|nr:ABC transporter ATP-binding protein [Formosa algae]MBP1840975.1 ABC-type bacteriocin/lantibiotic exporter with double-glycine peptidase domain [Formosa algae]MDQ0336128.1 ABC-type bacteriocin/lantibiotic exporter with double-glycine peptidase domain [Formosa algae]OEI79915.1 ABC transporter ATP-binding protein/permease [Formosa algae]
MKSKTLTPWRRFIGLLKLERKDIYQVAYYAVFEGIVGLSLPLGIQAIINLLQGAQTSASLYVLIVLVTSGVAFSGVLRIMQMRIIETIQQRIFTRASIDLSYRFPKIKMSELRNYYLPELANRFFDTLTIQKGLSKILIDVPSALLQIILALVLLSFYHPFFMVFGLLLLLLIYVVFKYTAQRGLDTSLVESKYKYSVVHWLQEISRAVVSFKISGRTSLGLQKSDSLVSNYLEARESHFKVLMIQFAQMISFKVLVTAGLLVIGGLLVLDQRMNIGQFVAAEIVILLIINSVEKLLLGLESFYDVLTSIEKLGQVVDKPLEAQEGESINPDSDLTIELNNVSYKLVDQNKPILNNLTFTINQKDRIWIKGESGSGKSSLIQLISGILEPTSGYIYVNNLSIESLFINEYRAHLGLSLSDESPFEGTIKENVTFGNPNITNETIYSVFEELRLTEFLKQQPKGLSTILKPEGKQVPYTVIRKILIARALIKQPKLLIFEDPLDHFPKDEADRIIKLLTDYSRPWSLIVVSNSEHWKDTCNKQITLKNGNIINEF